MNNSLRQLIGAINFSTPFPFMHNVPMQESRPSVEDMLANGVKLLYLIDPCTRKGGVTVAYREAGAFRNSRMVEVSVAYCNPRDFFSKKIGRSIALENFYNGASITLPLRDPSDDNSIVDNLKTMFGQFY